MSYIYSLQKVLEVKRREKNTAEGEYQEATRDFEEAATDLYQLLKRKELLEGDYDGRLEQGINIGRLQELQTILMQLQVKVNHVQQQTQQARNHMNSKQSRLLDKTIELKKYEKMKEIKYEQFVQEVKTAENKQMDEISVQQFMNR